MSATGRLNAPTVLYVWDSDYPWDVRAEKTCLALREAGCNVHLVARNRKERPLLESLPEATVHRMAPLPYVGRRANAAFGFPAFFNPRWRHLIKMTAESISADVMIARDIPLCPTAIHAGKSLHIPVILDLAEHYPAMMQALWDTGRHRPLDYVVRNPRVVSVVERYCLRRVDHILTVADEMSNRVVGMGVARSRITCVPNTPARTQRICAPSRHLGGSDIELVYLGLLEVVRGINDVVDAIALLRDRGKRVRFVIIGSGRDEQVIRDHANAAGLLDGSVEFTGHIPYQDAMARVAGADIGVLPLHRNEHMDTTLPNKLFDYMSVGLPVLTSDTPPSARIVRNEGVGEVFAAGNPQQLAEGIEALMDPKVRDGMRARAIAAIGARYNWDQNKRSLVNAVLRTARKPLTHKGLPGM